MPRQNADNGISPLYIDEVDNLLDELASHAPHSHTSIHARFPPEIRRNIKSLLHSLYYTLSPIDASYITQIILKDIRPLLYPPQATHYTAALLKFNAASITILTKEDAMKAWDPTFLMIKAYRVRSTLDQAAASFELGAQPLPVLGVPIEVNTLSVYSPLQFSYVVLDPQVRKGKRLLPCAVIYE